MSKHLEMYTKNFCIYCYKAKEVINNNPDMSFSVTEYNVDTQKAHLDTLKERLPGVKTVPIVVLDGQKLGGYQELTESVNRMLLKG